MVKCSKSHLAGVGFKGFARRLFSAALRCGLIEAGIRQV